MRLWEIFRFELAYQARRPWPWLMLGLVMLVSFLMTRDAAVADALYEDFFVNSPFSIAISTVVGGLLWLVLAPIIAGEAAARDAATGMEPLTYTAPATKSEYLAGRFLAALALNALILFAVQAGIVLAVYSPGVNARLIGPFRPAAHLTAYAFISLPNAFVATAVQFSIATKSGRPVTSYLGSMVLVFMGFFVASLLLFKRGLGTLLDPTGIRFIVEDIAHLWTTIEKNSRLLAFEGIVLENRLLWLGIAAAVLALTYTRFRFAHRAEGTRWWPKRWRPPAAGSPYEDARVEHVSNPRISHGLRIQTLRTIAIARSSFRAIAKSWAGFGVFAGIPLLTVIVLLDQMMVSGVPLLPTTGQVLKELTGPLSSEMSRWVIIPLLTVFFAGEVIWRERETGLDEITDAAPIRDWVPFAGKFLGLAFVLGTLLALLMTAGVVTQIILDHRDFDLGLYITVLFGLQLPEYLLFALLAMAVHVLVGHKYIGHLTAIAVYTVMLLAPTFGIEHDLLIYGAGPWWTYTSMRGLGPYIEPWLWFKLYWAAWALLIAVMARLLWLRGLETSVASRLRIARRRLTPAAIRTFAGAAALVLVLGGFVFYNTNILNEYMTDSDFAERSAEYERRYARYARVPQPHLVAANLRIEIHPAQGAVDVRGEYRLVNNGMAAIDSIHIATTPSIDHEELTFDRRASRVHADAELGHVIYRLEKPLRSGESLRLDFRGRFASRGFREGGADAVVVENGSYFSGAWLPAIGYQSSRELLTPSDRRGQGLSARPVIASLYDEQARTDRGPGVMFEAVVSTDQDQIAVAPGVLRRSWIDRKRSYFHYSTDRPIGTEWAFASADYGTRAARWNDVEIQIFHHPQHTAHLDRLVAGIEASLEYLTTHVGPFPYGHVTVLEIPGDGVGMHADASMITHGEGVTLLRPERSPRRHDLPFAITAHEMAHQWAIPSAIVEGIPVMAEGIASYYAIEILEHAYGRDQMLRHLSFMRQPYPYPPIHRGEPLLRGLDPWMAYRKAPFALHALGVYIGEDRVNGALRRVWEKHRPEDAPLATTLDLYRELHAVTPDSMRYLLHDLFEVNTFWQFRTEQVTAVQTDAGDWQVTLDLRARKTVVDSAGVETHTPTDEWVQIGVFGAAESGRHELSRPLHLRMHRIRSGQPNITLTVPERPILAGIDPFHLLDWEEGEDDDNIEGVEIAAGGG